VRQDRTGRTVNDLLYVKKDLNRKVKSGSILPSNDPPMFFKMINSCGVKKCSGYTRDGIEQGDQWSKGNIVHYRTSPQGPHYLVKVPKPPTLPPGNRLLSLTSLRNLAMLWGGHFMTYPTPHCGLQAHWQAKPPKHPCIGPL
jgi:hypothetical protein